jgi:hypothetical protein
MAVLLAVILGAIILVARRPLWSGGAGSRALYLATVAFAVVTILLLVIERIEARGEYH